MRNLRRFVLLPVLVSILAGCAPSPTFLSSASLIAGHQAALYRDILIESIAIFILVIGSLIWILIRDRSRSDNQPIPRQIHGKLSWVAVPVLLIVLLDGADFFWMARTMRAIAAPSAAVDDIHVHVIGHRWWWEFDYTDLGVKTANELHIPEGGIVQLTLDSVDVIHSFWIPQLSGKTDVIPGQTNHMWLTADRTGTFIGQCAEFCGLEHAMMRIDTVVDSPADFSAWVANQQSAAALPESTAEVEGWKTVTTVCSPCHSLDPAEPKPLVGPNLAHLMSRSTFAGATFDLTPENLHSWLDNTQTMKPGNDMDLKLTPRELDAVQAYLMLLK